MAQQIFFGAFTYLPTIVIGQSDWQQETLLDLYHFKCACFALSSKDLFNIATKVSAERIVWTAASKRPQFKTLNPIGNCICVYIDKRGIHFVVTQLSSLLSVHRFVR